MDHTFVICAYQKSPYLEACIRSLKTQTEPSEIKMVTSTPNAFIAALAEKYQIPLAVNTGKAGITQDWNFGLEQAATPYVTLAHQDDLYKPEYTRTVVGRLKTEKRPLICFTNYSELWKETETTDSPLLRVKGLLLLPVRLSGRARTRLGKRFVLAFGNAICCPSVAFARENIKGPVFAHHFVSNGDWEAWERLSRQKGAFLYCPQVLMSHRIHPGSTTAKLVTGTGRFQEDFDMFCRFWPKGIAKLIMLRYQKGEKSNIR